MLLSKIASILVFVYAAYIPSVAWAQTQKAKIGKIEIQFELSTGSSFAAKATSVVGNVVRAGSTVKAPPKVLVHMKYLKTGISLRDKHMLQRLEVEKYPTAEATGITIKSKDEGTATIRYRGVEKKADFKYETLKDAVKIQFPVKISDYNLEEMSFMGVSVEDEAEVTLLVPIQ